MKKLLTVVAIIVGIIVLFYLGVLITAYICVVY